MYTGASGTSLQHPPSPGYWGGEAGQRLAPLEGLLYISNSLFSPLAPPEATSLCYQDISCSPFSGGKLLHLGAPCSLHHPPHTPASQAQV